MMATIFIEVMCLEEAFEVLDYVIWRDEVAGIILRMRLYMRDAGVIGDECLIANLIDLPTNFKEYWCVWGNDVPTDIWLEGDIHRDQKMLPTWVVWSDQFAVLGNKPIVALTQDGQTIRCGLFYILDRKEFVLNDRWLLRAVLGTAGQEIDELAKLTAWDLSDLVDAYSHMAGRWTRQQDGNYLIFFRR